MKGATKMDSEDRSSAVLRLRGAGKTYREIADQLDIQPGLVGYYVAKNKGAKRASSAPSSTKKPRKKRIQRSQRAPIGTPGRLEALKAAALEYARPIVLAEVLKVTMDRRR
jgi:hypothetical protein